VAHASAVSERTTHHNVTTTEAGKVTVLGNGVHGEGKGSDQQADQRMIFMPDDPGNKAMLGCEEGAAMTPSTSLSFVGMEVSNEADSTHREA